MIQRALQTARERIGISKPELTFKRRLALTLAVVLALAVVPPIIGSGFLLDTFILMFLFMGLGHAWNIVGGYAGQISIGHAIMWGVGAYATMFAYITFGITPYIGIFIGGFFAAGAGLVLGAATFRLEGHYFAMATLAAGVIVNLAFKQIDTLGGATGLRYEIGVWNEAWSFTFASNEPYFYIAGIFALLVTGYMYVMDNSRLAIYLKAIKMDQELAKNAGINVFRYKMYAMGISSFISGIAGGLYAQYLLFINPDSVFFLLVHIDILLIPVIGGLSTVIGPVLGAAIYIPVRSLTRTYLSGNLTGLGWITLGIVLILISIYRPQGLLGEDTWGE
jgi:branched-chain amino acid transport system permease protein